jgi:hypothetical protein
VSVFSHAERRYLGERGFQIVGEATARLYAANSLKVNKALTKVPSNNKDPHSPWYWTAVVTSQDDNVALELVVSASEQISDLITAFVTAELRAWRRQ